MGSLDALGGGVPMVRVSSLGSTRSHRSQLSTSSHASNASNAGTAARSGGGDEDSQQGGDEEGIYETDEGYLLLDSIWAVIAVRCEVEGDHSHQGGRGHAAATNSSEGTVRGRYRKVQLPPI